MDRWSSLVLLAFVRVKPKLKETAIPDKDNIYSGYALIIFIIGSISVRGLLYRLCYSIKFIITLNKGLGLQLLAQNS